MVRGFLRVSSRMLDVVTHQAVLDAIPASAAIVADDGTIVAVNRQWIRFAEENGGDARTHYLGANYFDVCDAAVGETSVMAATVADGLREVLRAGGEFRCEYPCHSQTELRWFELTITPLGSAGPPMALTIHADITPRVREREATSGTDEHLHRLGDLVASATDAIISYDLEGRVLTWNAAATALYGYQPDEVIGRSLEILYPPDWPMRITDYRDLVLADRLRQGEVVRMTKSGTPRDIAISAAPVRDAAGNIISVMNIHRDITEAKRTREHLTTATRELSHRAKNLLAVILSVQRQTARDSTSFEEFDHRFSARLSALSASIDLLAARNWGHIALAELASRQLAAFVEPDDPRVSIAGPAVQLDSQAVEALGMALHELATNALKYGALSGAGGGIELTWKLRRSDGQNLLDITWHETAPGIHGAPGQTGFGHAVMTRIAAQRLGADVSLDFGRGELSWRAEVPGRHFNIG